MGIIIPVFVLIVISSWAFGGSITVDYGRMVIKGYKNCNVSINNNDKMEIYPGDNGYIHEGLVFGLVSWWCDNEYGSLVKNIECKDCGLYCTYNQQFDMCRTNAPIITSGSPVKHENTVKVSSWCTYFNIITVGTGSTAIANYRR